MLQINTNYIKNALITKSDPTHLWQVLMNILLNAIQAMPDRGGTITITVNENKMRDGDTFYRIDRNPDENTFARITIADQGPGIDPEKIDKIFKPFYTTRPEGTGLGLAIVKRLADENHWKLDVKSELGIGTEFVLLIPVYNN